MKRIGVAFDVIDNGQADPVRNKRTSCHMMFDVEIDFTRKARWAIDRHMNPALEGSTCTGVVSRESIKIAFTYAALKDSNV